MKKVFKIVLTIVFVFITGLIITPFFLKDKVVEIIRENINERIDANVGIKSVNLSFFRSFPELSVAIMNVEVYGKENFEGVVLLNLEEIYASVNIISLIKYGRIDISEIRIHKPDINLIELCDGKQNWNIIKSDIQKETKSESVKESSSNLNLNIDKFIITNGKLHSIMPASNSQTFMSADLDNVNIKFSGEIYGEKAKLNADLSIGSFSILHDKIPYASNLKIDSKIIVDADFKEQLFTFEENSLSINELKTSIEGWVSMRDSSAIAMDLKMNTNDISFKDILSLVPVLYSKDFQNLNAEGKVNLEMWVSGELRDRYLPAFDAKLKVENGSFGYPKLPSRVTDINVDLGAASKGGSLDNVVVGVNKFHINMAGSSIDIEAKASNIETDINYYAKAAGIINLEKISEIYPMKKNESLKGKVNADFSLKGKISEIKKELYENIEAKGYLQIEDIDYQSPEIGVLKVNKSSIVFSPKYVNLEKFDAHLNSSDILMNGRLENLIGYALNSNTLRGELNINSNKIVLNDFISSAIDSVNVEALEQDTASVLIIPKNLDFRIDVAIKEIKIDDLIFNDLQGKMQINKGIADISAINMRGLGGRLAMKGKYDTNIQALPKADLSFNIVDATFKKSFESITSLQKIAPIFENMTGRYSMDFDVKTNILPDFAPDLNTLWAKGGLKSSNLSVSNVATLDKMADLLKYNQMKNLNVKDFDLSFVVENGRMTIKPIDIKAGNLNMNIYGTTGLNKTIDMKGKLSLPSDEIKLMGMNVKNLPFTITGTFSKPDISLDTKALASEIKDNIKSSVKDAIADKLGLKRDSITSTSTVMSEEKKIEIIETAKKQASAIVTEAQKQGNKLIEKAGSNKLKKIAAEKAAEKLVKEAQKQADRILAEAESL